MEVCQQGIPCFQFASRQNRVQVLIATIFHACSSRPHHRNRMKARKWDDRVVVKLVDETNTNVGKIGNMRGNLCRSTPTLQRRSLPSMLSLVVHVFRMRHLSVAVLVQCCSDFRVMECR
mmetsp:Transcript_94130/g.148830  ORF Transcript_94130/g.148830 Transcript_94130/m.148830 type:complete len:119 (+) Transcript_94130:878-1234(+)